MHHRYRPTSSISRSPISRKCKSMPLISLRMLRSCVEPLDRAAPSKVFPAAPSKSLGALLISPRAPGSHMPKLLSRPQRSKTEGTGIAGNSNKSRSRGAGGGGDGGGSNRDPETSSVSTLAALVVRTGLVGTTALVLGNIAGINLWGAFDWASLDDLKLAATASVPLQLLNAILLLPNYSSPRQFPSFGNLENLEAKLRSDQRRREAAVGAPVADASTLRPSEADLTSEATFSELDSEAPATTAIATNSTNTTNTTTTDVSAAFLPTPTPTPPMTGSTTADEERPQPLPPQFTAAAAGTSAPSSVPGPSTLTVPMDLVPAVAWGRSEEGRSRTAAATEEGEKAEGSWARLRGALHFAQGFYINNNPTARLTPQGEAVYALLDATAEEMLYRGVLLTWLSTWLQDRVYEAGSDEVLLYQLPAAAEALGLPALHDAVAALGVYGICQCAVAASVAASTVWSVTARSRKTVRHLETIMNGVASSSSSSPPSFPSALPSLTGRRGASEKSESAAAPKAKTVGRDNDGGTTRAAGQVLFLPTGAQVGASNAVEVVRRGAAIQAARDALQILVLSGIFIASGSNLAASFSAAVLNQLLISAMQRRGEQRLRERNEALLKEFKAYNEQMQRIALKYKDKVHKAAATRLEAMDSKDEPASPPRSSSSVGASSSPAASSCLTSSSVVNDVDNSSSNISNGSDNDSSDGNDNISRTLATIDSLVPEPPKSASADKRMQQVDAQRAAVAKPQQPLLR